MFCWMSTLRLMSNLRFQISNQPACLGIAAERMARRQFAQQILLERFGLPGLLFLLACLPVQVSLAFDFGVLE